MIFKDILEIFKLEGRISQYGKAEEEIKRQMLKLYKLYSADKPTFLDDFEILSARERIIATTMDDIKKQMLEALQKFEKMGATELHSNDKLLKEFATFMSVWTILRAIHSSLGK